MEPGDYIFIKDKDTIPASLLSIPKRYENYVDQVLVNSGLIQDRVTKLAEEIGKRFEGQSLTIIVVLKGAFRFAKDLVEALDKTGSVFYNLEFIRMKSYENDSQNEISVDGLEKIEIRGKKILILEDLVDSGNTLNKLKSLILSKEPESLTISVLIFKRNPKNVYIFPDIIGFSIPNEWIVGYNMDYNERFRDLSHIGILNDRGKEEFRV